MNPANAPKSGNFSTGVYQTYPANPGAGGANFSQYSPPTNISKNAVPSLPSNVAATPSKEVTGSAKPD
jgi:hypothetical protein